MRKKPRRERHPFNAGLFVLPYYDDVAVKYVTMTLFERSKSTRPTENLNMESSPDPENSPREPEFPPSFWTRFLPIPRKFHSLEKDGPFTHCVLCNVELIQSNSQYVIEKVFRAEEVIVEMAICFGCRQSTEKDSISEDSRRAIENFFASKTSILQRPEILEANWDNDSVDPWLDTCLFDGRKMDGLREYQIIALCQGDKIQRGFLPAAISNEAMEALSDVLSEQTKGWMKDFLGDTFGMPPEFCEPPSYTPVLF